MRHSWQVHYIHTMGVWCTMTLQMTVWPMEQVHSTWRLTHGLLCVWTKTRMTMCKHSPTDKTLPTHQMSSITPAPRETTCVPDSYVLIKHLMRPWMPQWAAGPRAPRGREWKWEPNQDPNRLKSWSVWPRVTRGLLVMTYQCQRTQLPLLLHWRSQWHHATFRRSALHNLHTVHTLLLFPKLLMLDLINIQL